MRKSAYLYQNIVISPPDTQDIQGWIQIWKEEVYFAKKVEDQKKKAVIVGGGSSNSSCPLYHYYPHLSFHC